VRLFWRAANRGRDGRPIILFFNDFFGDPPDTESLAHIGGCTFTTDRRTIARAAAVVFHIPSLPNLSKMRKRRGQLWVAWSMESEVHYPQLADQAFMQNFDLTITYQRSADIWCSYLPNAAAFERALATPIPPKTDDAPVVMLQTSTIDRCGRNRFAQELMSHIKIDSFGRFLNNRQLETTDRGHETKLALIAPYKFCIAFENSIAVDYVTEKFFDPFLVGTVPIYRGASNIDMFAPGDNAFIDASKFSGPRDLADFLNHLDSDQDAYRQFFKWREIGLSAGFNRLLLAASKEPFCQLCEIVRERQAMARR